MLNLLRGMNVSRRSSVLILGIFGAFAGVDREACGQVTSIARELNATPTQDFIVFQYLVDTTPGAPVMSTEVRDFYTNAPMTLWGGYDDPYAGPYIIRWQYYLVPKYSEYWAEIYRDDILFFNTIL